MPSFIGGVMGSRLQRISRSIEANLYTLSMEEDEGKIGVFDSSDRYRTPLMVVDFDSSPVGISFTQEGRDYLNPVEMLRTAVRMLFRSRLVHFTFPNFGSEEKEAVMPLVREGLVRWNNMFSAYEIADLDMPENLLDLTPEEALQTLTEGYTGFDRGIALLDPTAMGKKAGEKFLVEILEFMAPYFEHRFRLMGGKKKGAMRVQDLVKAVQGDVKKQDDLKRYSDLVPRDQFRYALDYLWRGSVMGFLESVNNLSQRSEEKYLYLRALEYAYLGGKPVWTSQM